MSKQSRIKLCVLGVIALVQPLILMFAAFGVHATPEQAATVQAVAAGIGAVVLAALGISTQNPPPPEEPEQK